MKKKHLVLAAVSMAVAGTIGVSIARGFAEDDKIGAGGNGDNPYAFGLWGDQPYSTLQATVGVPNLIADMNSQNLAFTAHDGDILSGSGTCTDSVYTQALGFFNSLKAPAIFTPGDNDWVDCDRQPGFDALTQLDKERALYFSTPFTMGLQRFREEVQATPLCLGVSGPVACVENRRWHVGRVTYATLNIQGSCNNLCGNNPNRNAYIPGNQAEYDARNAADIAWMQETFAEAAANGSAAVMFVTQADPGFNLDSSQGGPLRDPMTLAETDGLPDGFQTFLLALRAQVIAFKRPVAYVHGDSHYFRIDKPLLNAAGQRLENFTRVETFGDNQQNGTNDVNWLKVLVDPNSREMFAYQPQIVPGNRTAVPAP
ncbi:MAG TPA: hypothetical protein VGQ49_03130 [Bryobacteraceae bacterium]|nr:hypothetical protein [Bryobacteraceae bacterium]